MISFCLLFIGYIIINHSIKVNNCVIFITHILRQITVFYLIQDIAERMGFDTRKSSSLWKDRTLVEINVAVLYSFQVGSQ